MTEYVVIANKLNFRDAPVTGNVLAILPRGQLLSDAGSSPQDDWLKVKTSLPSADDEVVGFVAAQFAEAIDGQPPQQPATPTASIFPTAQQLKRLAPAGKNAILESVAAGLAKDGTGFGLTNSVLRLCHFLAQAAHESANFRTTREFWGPTKAQLGYEGRKDLGNTRLGDGKLFMGRGIFQLTGRANYRTMGPKLGLDIENNPDLAAEPANSFKIACIYWNGKKLNELADTDDIRTITRRINGGLNGFEDRKALYRRARQIFG